MAVSVRVHHDLAEATAEATVAAPSTRNKTRFRMPGLFADTQEICAAQLKQALQQSSKPAPQGTVAQSLPRKPARHRLMMLPTHTRWRENGSEQAENSSTRATESHCDNTRFSAR
jgi:beta-phosphoglucomutase-like phosphatase (HAD superfamily)